MNSKRLVVTYSICSLAAVLMLTTVAHGGVIVSETFDTDGSIDLYTGAGEVFSTYLATDSPVAQASGGELRLALEGGTAGDLSTLINFGGAQSLISMRYDYKANTYSAANVPWGVYFGAYTDISYDAGDFRPNWTPNNGSRSWSMTTVASGNPYSVNAQDGTQVTYSQGGYSMGQFYTWSYFLNQSGSAQQFLGPDGVTTYTLDNDHWSLFVDNTLIADNVVKGTADADTLEGVAFDLGRNWSGGTADQSIDNIIVRDDLQMYVPEPATLALLSLGGLGLLRRKR